MFYSIKETTFDCVGTNFKINNTKLRRLQAEQTQWKCVHCLLTKDSLSVAPLQRVRGPWQLSPLLSHPTVKAFAAKLIRATPATGTPASQHSH